MNKKLIAPSFIGCAGWSISSAVSTRFSGDGTHLERYARVFNAVEINSSFYRPHQPKTYARWAASVPDAFRFSVKMPRTISHELRLRDAEPAAVAFIEQVAMLGGKLGCLLLQLPPSLAVDIRAAERFFAMLRGLTSVPVVCEPRHASWFTAAAAKLFSGAGIAYVHAHPAPIPGVEPGNDSELLYIRLHGAPRIYYSSYDDAFLNATAEKIVAAARAGRQAWCVFDNTAGGEAVPNALALKQRFSTCG